MREVSTSVKAATIRPNVNMYMSNKKLSANVRRAKPVFYLPKTSQAIIVLNVSVTITKLA